ncbi:unnamed protein product [Mytilus edulis]|uniref:Death domain-containing protein n=1 Tax=Mytilus edulis TaxID=6550 RepID=A0A8S3VKL6_MYTED|nr:unnamed protein product [Mytilus edulis]
MLRQSHSGNHFTVSTDITLCMNNISNDFFMYCSKSIPEYTDFEMHIGPDDRMFSDVYEIKTWGQTPKYVRVNIAVLGFVKQNQDVSVRSFEGYVEGSMISREVLTLKDDSHAEEYTKFDIKIDLTRMKSAKFVVLVHLRHEEFDVSHKSLKLIPQSESGAEINISEGTFERPGKLMLNMADTNYWNTDEIVLFTNALNIKMQNNIKPKKPVNIKLPLHSSLTQSEDLLIISSDKDIPETEDDWDICSTNIDIQGNIVSFNAEHFTSFAPVSKTKIKQSKNVLTKAVGQYKPTEIFAGIKELDNKLTLIVEIALKNRGRKRRKHWKKKGFGLPATEYRECISVKGNFEIDSIRMSGGEQLIFNPAKNSFGHFIVPEEHEHYLGCIIVSRSTQKIAEHSVVKATRIKRKPGLFRLFYKNVVEVETPIQVTIENATEELVSLPIDGQFLYIEDDYVDEDDTEETTVVKNGFKGVDVDKDDLQNKGDERGNTDDVAVHEDLQNKDDEIPSTDAIVNDEDLQSEGDEKPSTDDVVDYEELQSEGDEKPSTDDVVDDEELQSEGDEKPSTDDVVDDEELQSEGDEKPSTDDVVDDEELQSEGDEKPSTDDAVDYEDLQSEEDEKPSTDDKLVDDDDLQSADDDRGSTDDKLVDKDDQQSEGAKRGINEDLDDNIKDVESINVNIYQPKEIVYLNNPKDINDDIYDPQCTIPVLKKSSLFRLAKQLSVEECFKLGKNLNISEKKLLNIKSKPDVKNAVFEIWRPIRPNETLVSRLVQALTNINKREEAEAINNAFAENIEFRP